MCERFTTDGSNRDEIQIALHISNRVKTACSKLNEAISKSVNTKVKVCKEAISECKSICLKAITLHNKSRTSIKTGC